GVQGSLRRWIRDFLSSRKSCVKVSDSFSSFLDVLSGVPQGSVLGRKLFTTYTADIPTALSCACALYVEDMKLYADPIEDHRLLQRDLKYIYSWSSL
ncbi:RVT 1 domain containing protein, partial [Asbolus verrucosus]